MASKFRQKIFSCQTPIPEVFTEGVLYEDTWESHIRDKHPEVDDHRHIENTLTAPTLILDSSSVTGNYLFINQSVTDLKQRPLRVAVKPSGPIGEVVSAYYSSNVTNAGVQVWPKKDAKKHK